MPGSYWEQDGRWVVGWWHTEHKKQYKISRYEGMTMRHEDYAKQLLAEIRAAWKMHQKGLAPFRIEKWTKKGYTDVIEFFEEWLKTKKKKKPSTYKGYKSYLKTWIAPFFEKHPVMLHEIQLDTLDKMLDFIKLSGKGKLNVMMCFHIFMDYAWRSKRIPEMPPFPKLDDYDLVEPDFDWLWEDQQLEVINTIPEEHRPIFLFLKYHYRRPGEACAIQWRDWDEINRVFVIKRAISARKIVESTKTKKIHYIPCHSAFYPIMRKLKKDHDGLSTDFIFQNPRARREGKRYSLESLGVLWKAACKKVGIKIGLYHGTKHSSCTQFINEKGGSDSELQMLTDHARLDSVTKYRKVGVSRKRELMERGKVVDIKDYHNLPQTENGRKKK